MELIYEYDAPPLTSDALAKFESANRLTIPEPYRSLLLAHNGADFGMDYPAYRIQGNERQPEGLLQCFFCLADGDPIDLGRILRVHRKRLPNELLPIGSDPGNNLICLGIKGKHQGKVYFWERTKEHSPPTFSNVYLLALDFQAFLDGLYPCED